ncbi:MAG: TetR/AcrR family transcriptional regulator [Bryobacteraceae bacterium]|jgi:TetR/AcrR family transcriptional repressor of nem operon
MMKSDQAVSRARMTKGEQTRRNIVAAAAPIFNQHGYEGSSLADLMSATGLKKGGIYRHFSSKEELAAEAFDFTWESAWKARMLHVDKETTGVVRLKQLIANFIDYRSPIAGGCPILNTAVDADDGNSLLRERVSKALRWWLGQLQSIVKQAAKRGEIRSGVDPRAVATLVVATLEGALMISRLERSDYALRRAQDYLNRFLETEVSAPVAANQ